MSNNQNTEQKDLISRTKSKISETPEFSEHTHKRKVLRLETAKLTIILGFVVIGGSAGLSFASQFMTITGELRDISNEVLRDVIVVASTIVTLALGFIAGSNIE